MERRYVRWRDVGRKTQSMDRLHRKTDRQALQADPSQRSGIGIRAGETCEHPEIQSWRDAQLPDSVVLANGKINFGVFLQVSNGFCRFDFRTEFFKNKIKL